MSFDMMTGENPFCAYDKKKDGPLTEEMFGGQVALTDSMMMTNGRVQSRRRRNGLRLSRF